MDSASDPYPNDDHASLQDEHLKLYGLIGKSLTHSFSQKYFLSKFKNEELEDHYYALFPLDDIDDIRLLLEVHKNLKGLNVTIPYKESVIPYLDELDPVAAEIGAVNCIYMDDFEKKGYNTDWLGFRDSIFPLLRAADKNALVLGAGGSSKAVCYALKQLGLSYKVVSREAGKSDLTWDMLTTEVIAQHTVIINTTPVGMWPDADAMPPVPIDAISPQHICFDLIYNPEQTRFLQEAASRGAVTSNGKQMLELQAAHAWKIWNTPIEEKEE